VRTAEGASEKQSSLKARLRNGLTYLLTYLHEILGQVCYKVSLCENCQRQSCRPFIGLTIHAKIIGGGRPLLPEILGETDRVGAKSPIFDLFSPVAQQP